MTMKVEYKCPNCGHHLFNAHYDPAGGTPPHATGEGMEAPSGNYGGNTSKDGTVCPKCGNNKSPGFDTCYECAKADMDECPNRCGRLKKKQYPVCFQCSREGSSSGNNGAGAGVADDEDDEDAPF